MLKKIFISYQRLSKDKVNSLASDITKLGYEVWFDQELGGGQNWWNTILESILKCDIFIFAISEKALESQACKREYQYAANLNKPILPILIDGEGVSINLLPPELSQIQFIDYQYPNRETAFQIAKSLLQIPSPKPPPDPLPEIPDIPISYIGSIAKQIEADTHLNFELQSSVLLKLKNIILESPSNYSFILLKKFRGRKDLFASIASEIDELLDNKDEVSSLAFFKRKKNIIFLLLVLFSIVVILPTYNIISNEQNEIDSSAIPDWILKTPFVEDGFYGIGVSRHQNLEIAQRTADNLARHDLNMTINLNIEEFLKGASTKKIKKNIAIENCEIVERQICSDGLVFSLALVPLPLFNYHSKFESLVKINDTISFSDSSQPIQLTQQTKQPKKIQKQQIMICVPDWVTKDKLEKPGTIYGVGSAKLSSNKLSEKAADKNAINQIVKTIKTEIIDTDFVEDSQSSHFLEKLSTYILKETLHSIIIIEHKVCPDGQVWSLAKLPFSQVERIKSISQQKAIDFVKKKASD